MTPEPPRQAATVSVKSTGGADGGHGPAGGREAEQVLEEERDDVYDRYLAYALRARQIPVGQKGSTEWVRELGAFWVGAREKRGLSRVAAARATNLSLPMIRYLEVGLLFDSELTTEPEQHSLFAQYAVGLGQPELLEKCRRRFGI